HVTGVQTCALPIYPTAGPPIDLGPAVSADRVADGHDVLVRKVDVNVAVRMRAVAQMPATHGAAADLELVFGVERSRGQRRLRQRQDGLTVPWPRHVRRQPQLRVDVRNDRGTRRAERLVRARMVGMP